MVVGANVHANPGRTPVGETVGREGDLSGRIPQFGGGRVAEKDGASGIDGPLVFEPRLANPEQLFLPLHVERHPRVVTSVNKAEMVEDDLGRERVKPHEVLSHLMLCFVQIAVGLHDVGRVGRFSSALHPGLPCFKRTVGLHALNRHLFVVALEANHLRMGTQEVNQAGRVWTSVDHVAQTHHAILIVEVQAVQQGPEGRKVTVNIAEDEDPVPVVQTRLQVCFKRGVA